MAKGSQAEYRAYLMRLWRESPQTPWRVLLIATDNQERRLFSSLEALFAFLDESPVSPPRNPDA